MCPPDFHEIAYVINPWMAPHVGRSNRQRSRAQWDALRGLLEETAAVELAVPVQGLPDMPFAANAGLVLGDVFVPSRFRFMQRAPEQAHWTAWFAAYGYRIVELPGTLVFEGEGDALRQPGHNLVWGGHGPRTSRDALAALAEMTGIEVVPLHLVTDRFYHLDTCFCPLANGRVLYHPPAFDAESLGRIHERIPPEQRAEVSAADARLFACNGIETGGRFIVNNASRPLRNRLRDWGLKPVICPVSEFQKSGGSAKCLVLRLSQGGRVAVARCSCE